MKTNKVYYVSIILSDSLQFLIKCLVDFRSPVGLFLKANVTQMQRALVKDIVLPVEVLHWKLKLMWKARTNILLF